MLPNEATNFTWCLACLIPVGLFGALYFVMRRVGQVLPLWTGILIILFYIVVIGFLFFSVGFPMLADLNQRLIYQRIQTDLDTQCGVGIVDAYSGQLDDSSLDLWRRDSTVRCVMGGENINWTCTCPTPK